MLYFESKRRRTMQFTLKCQDEDGTMTSKTFEGVYLDDVVSKTQDFLHGVGFVFEELGVQVYSVDTNKDTNDEVDWTSIYRDVD